MITIPRKRGFSKAARKPANKPSNPKVTEVRTGAKNQKEKGTRGLKR